MFVGCALVAWFCIVCFWGVGCVGLGVLDVAFEFGSMWYLHVLAWVWFACVLLGCCHSGSYLLRFVVLV